MPPGVGTAAPTLVAVTTLTSLNDHDLREIGPARPLSEHTVSLGTLAISSGIDGLVCSVHEAALFRKSLGNKPVLVTPGIRPAGADVGDQKRVSTPADAVKAGSSFLVVGRPILESPDMKSAALSSSKSRALRHHNQSYRRLFSTIFEKGLRAPTR